MLGCREAAGGFPLVSGVHSLAVEPRGQYHLWPFVLGHAGTARISESHESTSKNSSSLNTSLAAPWGFVLLVWGEGDVTQTCSTGLSSCALQGTQSLVLLCWGCVRGCYWYRAALLLS